MTQTPGGDLLSGRGKEQKKIVIQRKKPNGPTIWEEKANQSQEKPANMELSPQDEIGLNEKALRKLHRLENLLTRIVNIHVCKDCKAAFDSILEDTMYF